MIYIKKGNKGDDDRDDGDDEDFEDINDTYCYCSDVHGDAAAADAGVNYGILGVKYSVNKLS